MPDCQLKPERDIQIAVGAPKSDVLPSTSASIRAKPALVSTGTVHFLIGTRYLTSSVKQHRARVHLNAVGGVNHANPVRQNRRMDRILDDRVDDTLVAEDEASLL